MFKTFGEIIQEIEQNYDNKLYHRVVVESAKISEKALIYIFRNFHRTLEDTRERESFLEFEKEHGEKYAEFLRKPTIGIAIGYYSSLLGYFQEHRWLKKDLRHQLNIINNVRNSQLHAIKEQVTDKDASDILDAIDIFLKETTLINEPVEDLGFQLKHYLVYKSILEKFNESESEDDFKKIINDSYKILPGILNSAFNKIYPLLPIEDKELLIKLHPKTLSARSKELSIPYFIEIFEAIKLFHQMEDGEALQSNLLSISDKSQGSFNRRQTRHHVNILEILFEFIHNEKLDHFLEFADSVKKRYLEDSKINEKDRIILVDKAKELGISDIISEQIERTVVTTIEKDLILFQTLFSQKKRPKSGRQITEPAGTGVPWISLNRRTVTISGIVLVVIAAVTVYLIWPRSPFTAYERAYFEGKQEKAYKMAAKKRNLENIAANYFYISLSSVNNDNEFPEETISEYRKLYKDHPDSPEAQLYYGLVTLNNLYNNSSLDTAWMFINNAISMGIDNIYADWARHLLLQNFAGEELIITDSEELVQKHPDHPLALNNRALIYYYIGSDTLMALNYNKKTLEKYPGYMQTLVDLAEIYTEKSEFDSAEIYINEAFKRNKTYNGAIYAKAYLLETKGDYDLAEKVLLDAIALEDVSQEGYYLQLAYNYFRQEKLEESDAIFAEAKEKFPESYSLDYYKRQVNNWINLQEQAKSISESSKIDWLTDLEEAKKASNLTGKPVLLDLYNPGDYFEQILFNQYLKDTSVVNGLKRYIPVRIKQSEAREIRKQLELDFIRDLVILSSDGKKIFSDDKYEYDRPVLLVNCLEKGIKLNQRYIIGNQFSNEGITKVSRFEDASIISKQKKQPIMIFIGSENLERSSQMLEEINSDRGIFAEMRDLVYIELELSKDRAIIEQYDIDIFPAVLFTGEDGKVIHSVYGYKPAVVLADIISQVKDTYRTSQPFPQQVNWYYSLDEALSAAAVFNRNIFLGRDISLDNRLFSNREIIGHLSRDFICLRIIDPFHPDIMNRLGYVYYNSFLILNSSGQELVSERNLEDSDGFLSFIDISDDMKIISSIGINAYQDYYREKSFYEDFDLNGMYLSAENALLKLLEEYPEITDLNTELGNLYLNMHKYHQAMQSYLTALERDVELNYQVLNNIIKSAFSALRSDELFNWLTRQDEEYRSDPDKLGLIMLGYSKYYEILDQQESALFYASKAVDFSPGFYQCQLQYGRLLYYNGNPDAAQRHLLRASEIESYDATPLIYLGMIEKEKGNNRGKETLFQQAFEIDADVVASLATDTREYENYEKYPGYIKIIEQETILASEVYPDDRFYLLPLLEFYMLDKKDLDRAIELIERAESMVYETYTQTKYWLQRDKTLALLRKGDIEQATGLSKEVEASYPLLDWDQSRDILSDYTMGMVCLANRDTLKAADYFRKAVAYPDPVPYGQHRRLQREMDSILQTF